MKHEIRIIRGILLLLSLLATIKGHADTVGTFIATPNAQSTLDSMTRSHETINRISLLHLGKTSTPLRHQIISEAQNYVFMDVPYWFDDEEGGKMLQTLQTKMETTPSLDLRIMEDWSSPGSSGDLFGTNMIAKLDRVSGKNARLWNTPMSGQWSWDILRNRLHDKLLVVDGRNLIMGGMNVADDYLQGGLNRKGWHDTDIMLEGPAAQEGTKIFLKIWELDRYFSKAYNPFPTASKDQRRILKDYFYSDIESHDYLEPLDRMGNRMKKVKISIPIQKYLNDARYFPALEQDPSFDTPVRIIYDNPLIDQSVDEGDHFSKIMGTITYLLDHTEKRVHFFIPYLTISDSTEDALVRTAQRGVSVEILTNSRDTTDMGDNGYFAAASHYERLLKAGVKIYEWHGNIDLEEMEKQSDCTLTDGSWPGRTLHTKALILDDDVALIGSHNFNVRSEEMNSEIIALIRSSTFAQKLNQVFEEDIGKDAATILCGTHELVRPLRAQEMDLVQFQEFDRSHPFMLGFWRKFQELM